MVELLNTTTSWHLFIVPVQRSAFNFMCYYVSPKGDTNSLSMTLMIDYELYVAVSFGQWNSFIILNILKVA